MENRERVERIVQRLLSNNQGILFDITKNNWEPSAERLISFCRNLDTRIVERYQEIETTREYISTSHVLFARGCLRDQTLALSIGMGSTMNELIATRGMCWGLDGLIRKKIESLEPIYFRLLAVGYKDDDDPGKPATDSKRPLLVSV